MLPPNGETLLCFDCGGRSGYIARPEMEEICARVRRHFLQHELRSYEVIQKTRATL